MSRIDRLTVDQEALLPVFRDEWLGYGLSTEPADRPRAEAGVRSAYRRAGSEPPSVFVWLGSPWAGLIGVNMLNSDQVAGQVAGQVRDQVRGQVWGQVRDQVRGQVWGQVAGQVAGQVRDQVWGQVAGQVWGQVSDQVSDQVAGQVRDQVRGQVRGQVAWGQLCYGQHDAGWLAFYTTFKRFGVDVDVDGLAEVACSAGWWWPGKQVVVLTERPTMLNRDGQGRLHSLTGPAIAYPDGWNMYAVAGVRVPEKVVLAPESVTGEEWVGLPNEEVRRVVIELRGEALLAELDAVVVDSTVDTLGRPVRLWKSPQNVGGALLSMVELVNSTPEPDGHRKHYWIRVPNSLRRAGSAAAWHCQLSPVEWKRLAVQT